MLYLKPLAFFVKLSQHSYVYHPMAPISAMALRTSTLLVNSMRPMPRFSFLAFDHEKQQLKTTPTAWLCKINRKNHGSKFLDGMEGGVCDSTRSFLATSAIYGSKFSAVCQVPGSNFLYCSLKTWVYKSLMDSCRKNQPLVTSPWPLKKPPVKPCPVPGGLCRAKFFILFTAFPATSEAYPAMSWFFRHQKLGFFSMEMCHGWKSWLSMIVNSERVPFPGHSRSQKGMLDVWKMTGHKNI